MRAKKGEWFSIAWEPKDYYEEKSFKDLETCPRFIYAEEDTESIESKIESQYPDIRLTSIHLTSMFLKQEGGIRVPTHYRVGEFMPGDDLTYDEWLKGYHNISSDISEQIKDKELLQQKSIYLEHAAKIIRHDMHSGINTYIPRGLNSLLKKLTPEIIKELRLSTSIKLLQEGLKHSQKVYQGVYAFTNLVKGNPEINKQVYNLKEILEEYLENTAYRKNVEISDLVDLEVNKSLFCTAIDNFVKNGIAYNSNTMPNKIVKIYMEYSNELIIEDNGTGMSQQEYDYQTMPFIRKESNEGEISGLGINIANAILVEHGFDVKVEKLEKGTRIMIGF